MTEPTTSDEELRRAELRRLNAQADKDEAEQQKIEKEEREIQQRLDQPWWQRLDTTLKVVIGVIVAAALIWAFLLDNVLKLYSLNQIEKAALLKEQTALQNQITAFAKKSEETQQTLNKEREDFSDKRREFVISNNELKKQIKDVETSKMNAVTLLEKQVEEKNKQLNARLSPDEARALTKERDSAKAQITQLTKDLETLSKESNDAETRGQAITTSIAETQLQSFIWKYITYNPITEDLMWFEADGRVMMLLKDPVTKIEMVWKWWIEGNTLFLGENKDSSKFNLSGFDNNTERLHGEFKLLFRDDEVIEVVLERYKPIEDWP